MNGTFRFYWRNAMSAVPGKGRRAPSRLRFAGLVLLFVYPLVTLLLTAVMATTPGWPLWLRTALVVPVIVASMVWIIIPTIQNRLKHLL
jgi:antibiotic biosynthesis monooxygenase (ABM) superfamily enzyme